MARGSRRDGAGAGVRDRVGTRAGCRGAMWSSRMRATGVPAEGQAWPSPGPMTGAPVPSSGSGADPIVPQRVAGAKRLAEPARALVSACVLSSALLVGACAAAPAPRVAAAPPAPPGTFTFELASREADFEAAAAELAPLVAGQVERARRLEHLESRASFELRGDVVGGGFEQCEGDVFLAPGGRGAVRLTKLGENLAWIGGDASKAWVFIFREGRCEARVFDRTVSERAAATPGAEPREGEPDLVLLTPESVRVLAGLAPIPEEMLLARVPGAADGGTVRERFEIRWTLGSGAVAALRFGPDGLPATVALRRDGVELARSETSGYVRARIDSVAQGAWPFVPRKVRIVAPGSGADLRVYLDEPSAQAKRMKARFFELESLLKQFMPATVTYVEGPGVEMPSAEPSAVEHPTGQPRPEETPAPLPKSAAPGGEGRGNR